MITVEISGVKETQRFFGSMVDVDDIRQVLIEGGFEIEGSAKDLCPVDTGRLRASISTNWDGSGMFHGRVRSPAKASDGVNMPHKTSGDIAVVRVGTNVEYAPFVEYGTRRMSPRMFLTQAFYHHIDSILNRVQQIIKEN